MNCAGILGIDPGPFTLRELVRMTEARGRFEWGQTASLLAMIANVLRDPKKTKAVKPADFNPYNVKPKMKAPISILRDIWCRESQRLT